MTFEARHVQMYVHVCANKYTHYIYIYIYIYMCVCVYIYLCTCNQDYLHTAHTLLFWRSRLVLTRTQIGDNYEALTSIFFECILTVAVLSPPLSLSLSPSLSLSL